MLKTVFNRYPALNVCQADLEQTVKTLIECYQNGGKLLICGNGGSCADGEHIVGELMKGFLKKRPLSEQQKSAMKARCDRLDDTILDQLQQGLPAIALNSFSALNSAFCNDVDPELVYAQCLMALAKPGDVALCISTSGNAKNVLSAAKVAKALDLTVIALTGQGGGALGEIADLCIRVPETETYKVQELHLPVYHAICAAVEAYFFCD